MKIIEPIILKGTREFGPEEMAKRNLVMEKIKNIFARFGYDPIETPILNPAETILGKYGEEGDRLTYSFEDNGKKRLALPYDLTVPFARYFAANWQTLPLPFKRYQIQRVWRAEKPQKGRLREFYQCDIDIIGTESLIAEAEIARVIATVFEELNFKNFKIKINSRRLMNDILNSFGITENEMEVMRIIDKLAKIGQEAVQVELTKLGVENPVELLDLIQQNSIEKLENFDTSEVENFLEYCKNLGISEEVIEFTPSLARGLDYYTGIIFEVVSKDNPELGSLCGGGRYDNLCGLFSKEPFSGVGVAFGFERLMIAMEERGEFENLTLNSQILVTIFDEKTIENSLKIYELLTTAGLNTEIYFEPEKLKKQFKYADRKKIPFVIVQGPDEKAQNQVTVKSLQSGKQKTISIDQLITFFNGYEK